MLTLPRDKAYEKYIKLVLSERRAAYFSMYVNGSTKMDGSITTLQRINYCGNYVYVATLHNRTKVILTPKDTIKFVSRDGREI